MSTAVITAETMHATAVESVQRPNQLEQLNQRLQTAAGNVIQAAADRYQIIKNEAKYTLNVAKEHGIGTALYNASAMHVTAERFAAAEATARAASPELAGLAVEFLGDIDLSIFSGMGGSPEPPQGEGLPRIAFQDTPEQPNQPRPIPQYIREKHPAAINAMKHVCETDTSSFHIGSFATELTKYNGDGTIQSSEHATYGVMVGLDEGSSWSGTVDKAVITAPESLPLEVHPDTERLLYSYTVDCSDPSIANAPLVDIPAPIDETALVNERNEGSQPTTLIETAAEDTAPAPTTADPAPIVEPTAPSDQTEAAATPAAESTNNQSGGQGGFSESLDTPWMERELIAGYSNGQAVGVGLWVTAAGLLGTGVKMTRDIIRQRGQATQIPQAQPQRNPEQSQQANTEVDVSASSLADLKGQLPLTQLISRFNSDEVVQAYSDQELLKELGIDAALNLYNDYYNQVYTAETLSHAISGDEGLDWLERKVNDSMGKKRHRLNKLASQAGKRGLFRRK